MHSIWNAFSRTVANFCFTGIGKGLVALLLQRQDTLVIACIRPNNGSAKTVEALPTATGSMVITLELDAANPIDTKRAIDGLRSRIGYIDVVVANAGIAEEDSRASELRLEHLQKHMTVNTYAPLQLFQSTRDLMKAANAGNPKFVLIGAQLASITTMDRFGRSPLAAYSVSKLAANYFSRRFHFENDWLISFSIDPG